MLHFAENNLFSARLQKELLWERATGASRWAAATLRATPSPCRSVAVRLREVWLGDGDRSGGVGIADGLADGATHYSFFESSNHDHYESGNGSNDNGTSRGQYTGPGH